MILVLIVARGARPCSHRRRDQGRLRPPWTLTLGSRPRCSSHEGGNFADRHCSSSLARSPRRGLRRARDGARRKDCDRLSQNVLVLVLILILILALVRVLVLVLVLVPALVLIYVY